MTVLTAKRPWSMTMAWCLMAVVDDCDRVRFELTSSLYRALQTQIRVLSIAKPRNVSVFTVTFLEKHKSSWHIVLSTDVSITTMKE